MENGQEIISVPNQEVEVFDATEYMLSMAKRRATLLDTVKEVALKATNNQDWVDQNGTPYLTGSGAEKVIRRFGLKVWQVRSEKFRESDAKGEYYYFRTTGKVGFNENEFIEAIGSCSSRDQFFAKRNGVLMPIEEVDIINIEKSAYTNFLVNGATRFLGLRNLEWNEVEKYGIKKAAVSKVEYKSGKKSSKWSADHEDKAKRIGNFLLADADGDKKIASESLRELTKWKDKEGKEIEGKTELKNLSGKQIDMLWTKLKKNILEFENAGNQGDLLGVENGNSK